MKLDTLLAYLGSKLPVMRGKKAVQKLVYFCNEIGVPLNATFRMHIFGPYSIEVTEELGDAVTKEIIKQSEDGAGFTKGTKCEEHLVENDKMLAKHKGKIDVVVNTFGTKHPMQLELYATVHYIATAFREFKKDVTEEIVVKEVRKAKGNKFHHHEIQRAFRELSEGCWFSLDDH